MFQDFATFHLAIKKSLLIQGHYLNNLVYLAVAGDVFDGVFLCCPFSHKIVLDEILGLIESVSGGFSTYSWYYAGIRCDISSFKAIGPLVPEDITGFYYLLAWPRCWSCDLDRFEEGSA